MRTAHPRPRRRARCWPRPPAAVRRRLHGHRRQARLDDRQPLRRRRRPGAHLARLRDQHRPAPGAANGNVEPTAPGDAHRPDRRRGDDRSTARRRAALDQLYTLGYPVAAAGGSYTDEGVGAVELTGTFTFTRRTARRSRSSTRWSRSTGSPARCGARGTTADQAGSRARTTAPRRSSPRPLQRRRSRCAPTARARSAGSSRSARADTALAGFARQLAPLRHDEPDARARRVDRPTAGRRRPGA